MMQSRVQSMIWLEKCCRKSCISKDLIVYNSENESDHTARYRCYYDQLVDVTMLHSIQICGDEIQLPNRNPLNRLAGRVLCPDPFSSENVIKRWKS